MNNPLLDYKTVRGSDVIRDGLYLELTQESSGDVVAEIFYADGENRMSISLYRSDMPLEVVEAFIAKAKVDLPIR